MAFRGHLEATNLYEYEETLAGHVIAFYNKNSGNLRLNDTGIKCQLHAQYDRAALEQHETPSFTCQLVDRYESSV